MRTKVLIILISVIAVLGTAGFFVYRILSNPAQPTIKEEGTTVPTQGNMVLSTTSPIPSVTPASTGKSKLSNKNTVPAEKFSLFGTMVAYNTNDVLISIGPDAFDNFQKGWSVFKSDPRTLEKYVNSLQQLFGNRDTLVKKTNFSYDRASFAFFTWNVIEPEKGNFDWTLTDLEAQHARNSQIKISAVVQPFAGWDQKNTRPILGCQALDFVWYDNKAGPPNDWPEYQKFLEATVKRYKDVVSDWEIGNEYDGQCGGYQNNPAAYLKLLQISYETIKKTDSAAKVLNGGALEFSDASIKNFWKTFFQLGGGNYLDVFNVHYNEERNGAKGDTSEFFGVLSFYSGLIKEQGLSKPLWLTEFGTYSGAPQSPPPPPGGQAGFTPAFPAQSKEFQSAWYFRYSILAFAGNVEKIFVDLIGQDNNNVGGSAIYDLQGQGRPFLKTLQAIAAKIQGFDKVEKITAGQYRFTVGGKNVYALWSGSLPQEISGQVKVTNLNGEEKSMSAQEIKFSEQEPVLVEI